MTKQHSCVRLSTFIILHSQTKTSNSWIMKKNIFIGSRLRSRDREVIIFANYSCSSLFFATWGSTKKSQGHCWHKRQFFFSITCSSHTLTVRSYPKLEHKMYIMVIFLASSKQRQGVVDLQLAVHLCLLLSFSDTDVVHVYQLSVFQTFPNSMKK